MTERLRPLYNERLTNTLVLALRATNDHEALAALAAARRIISADGKDVSDFVAWIKKDHTLFAGTSELLDEAQERKNEAEKKMLRYQQRLAKLEALRRTLSRMLREMGGIDNSDYALKSTIERSEGEYSREDYELRHKQHYTNATEDLL